MASIVALKMSPKPFDKMFGENVKTSPNCKKIEEVYNRYMSEIEELRQKAAKKWPSEDKKKKNDSDFEFNPKNYDIDIAKKKMLLNSLKTIEEFLNNEENAFFFNQLVSPKEVFSSLFSDDNNPLQPSLQTKIYAAEEKGKRDHMEDMCFYEDNSSRTLCGVFDGHGGEDVAKLACDYFKDRFDELLGECHNNIHQAFETAFHSIHKTLEGNQYFNNKGSTAVVVYINKTEWPWGIYVATLGDSEAVCFLRNGNSKMQIILASRMLDWTSPKEAKRLAVSNRISEEALEDYVKDKMPKQIRSKLYEGGLNMSRALGDLAHSMVIPKPKITMFPLEFNTDTKAFYVLLSSDGLGDNLDKEHASEIINETPKESDYAKQLVYCAYDEEKSFDNITAIVVEITPEKQRHHLL